MSIEKVQKHFNNQLTDEVAKTISDILFERLAIDIFAEEGRFPKTKDWIERCYNMPTAVDIKLSIFNELLDGFGVEGIYHRDGELLGQYVNMGDTYAPTIIYECLTKKFDLSSMGDFVEEYDADVI